MAVKREYLYAIPLSKAEANVKILQRRLVRMADTRDIKQIKNLIRLMLHSYSVKIIAIEAVTRINKGKSTPGIDNKILITDKERIAASKLNYNRVKKYPVKRVYIPKRNGKLRPLGIPTIHERIQQKIYQIIMEPLYSVWGSKNSFGFRPGMNTRDVLERIWMCTALTTKNRIYIDGDIKGCFDNISHEKLIKLLEPYTTRIMREQIWLSLKSGAIEKGTKINTNEGTPQGGVISPLLANIALDELDIVIETMIHPRNVRTYSRPIVGYARYADDFVIILEDDKIISKILDKVKIILAEIGLELNMDKVKVVNAESGLNFLGYHIRRYPTGKTHVGIPKESVKNIKKQIKDNIKLMRGSTQLELIQRLNPIINGWANYYRWTRAGKTFSHLDSYLWYKLWKWGIRRHHRKGRKWIKSKYFPQVGNLKWCFSTFDNLKLCKISTFSRSYSEIYPKLNRNKNCFLDSNYFNKLQKSRSWKKNKYIIQPTI